MQTMKHFLKDQVVSAEGSRDERLFILVDGRIGIFKGSLKVAEFFEPGTIVGEMAVVLKQPRTATIKVLADTSLIVVDAQIDDLVRNFPDITLKILKNLAERLDTTTTEYWKLSEKINSVVDLKKFGHGI